MSKKLPKVFQNDFDKKINNNREVYYVKESVDEDFKSLDDVTVYDSINKIFASKKHFFNIPVEIVTNSNIYNTKIAGKINDYIITLDNDVIFIKDIISFKIKDRL